MKIRLRSLRIIFLIFALALSLSSCDLIVKWKEGTGDAFDNADPDSNEHVHAFSERIIEERYIKSDPTCDMPSEYFYSCVCGEKGDKTFTVGDKLGHTWREATCTSPKTCMLCQATEAEALPHDWKAADCQNRKTCLACGRTEGELGEHNIVNNSCTICGLTVKTEYTVRIVTAGGMPLEGVVVYVHNGEGYSLCAVPAVSDKNGVVSFELEISDEYSIELSDAPLGYEVKSGQTKSDRYAVTSTETVIALTSAPIAEGGFKSSYSLGDVMYDFTLTDVNGKSYKLSELLMTKDMVMLNFWFVNCIYCEYEFPYINSAYMKYKDSVEILAVNNYDSVTGIKAFAESFAVPLAMPMIREGSGADDLTLSRFPSHGYPTTVVIDRYGVVCLIEIGAVIGEDKWKNMFEHFVGEDYEQMLFTDDSIFNR